ncbi:MAG: bifunctional DNA-formamidopyrimidine glycosylase/DNA-(apurinic or apyrimidinic site) lyase [Pseudolabrys sp.]
MPELPDVENFKRTLDRTARNKKIAHVEVRAGKILQGVSARKLARALTGRKLTRSRRHGKHLFARIGNGPWLALHFGMTGYFADFKKLEDDPAHDRLRLDFNNGTHFAFVNQRKFGKLHLVDAPDDLIGEEKLGPDALDKKLTLKKFRALLGDRRGAIKAALMDQNLIAGIGNVYSDEILFQARLHPQTQVEDLDDTQVGNLYRVMRRVLQTAIKKGAGSEQLFERAPASYLLRHRESGAKCPRCGGKVKTMKAGGRTAYYCPKCQKR